MLGKLLKEGNNKLAEKGIGIKSGAETGNVIRINFL
ncbi:hypothetical protein Clopa_4847 [Clostridium pasteurianum BC1]|uniref:Uncharacterized protein n=1 Tax=Clostridium pasteurianum BC1 TaxID=86416 RepID=R4KCX8_CLOPA|nr:hypothetical protein Clopa_4847 [Clostridium pasteurianum BC1]